MQIAAAYNTHNNLRHLCFHSIMIFTALMHAITLGAQILGVCVLPIAKKQLRAKVVVKYLNSMKSSSTGGLRNECIILVIYTNIHILILRYI